MEQAKPEILDLLKRIFRERFTYFVILVIFLVIWAKNYKKIPPHEFKSSSSQPTSAPVVSSLADSIVNFALEQKGDDYNYASKGPDEFDCSGFIYYVYKNFKIELPASSITQFALGKEVPENEAKKADLIFFQGTDLEDPTVGHVGIVITSTNEKINFIHSSTGRGVVIDSLNRPNYRRRFVSIKRILE